MLRDSCRNINGVAVHDGFASYSKYGCEHALCNAHLKRELTGIEENFEQQWAKKINELFSEMKKYTDECREMKIPIDPEKSGNSRKYTMQ
jgi:transposase